jgi:hypothetical protein
VLGKQHREIDLEREQSCGGADHGADRAADAARGEAGELACTRGLFFAEEHSGTHTLTGDSLLPKREFRTILGAPSNWLWYASVDLLRGEALKVFMRENCLSPIYHRWVSVLLAPQNRHRLIGFFLEKHMG